MESYKLKNEYWLSDLFTNLRIGKFKIIIREQKADNLINLS